MTRARLLLLASIGAATFASAICETTSQASEPFPERAERIMSPGRATASDDTGEALVLNPANLAFLPSHEFRWTGVRCPDTQKVACGHAFDLATPLFFGLATGLRVDYVLPPSTAGFPYNGVDYTWLTWGLAWKSSNNVLAIGATIQRSYSSNYYTDALFGISAGISLRPNTHLGLSVVAHDFNGPSNEYFPTLGTPILDPSYVFAGVLRPTGTRAIELGLEAKYLEGSQQFIPKATLGIDIPGIGRARGDVAVAHLPNDDRRGVVATAGLELAIRGFTAGGGAIFGSGLGSSQSVAEYATASFSGYVSPGIPRPSRAVSIRIEHTPDARAHTTLLRKLWKIATTPDIEAVAMIIRAEPADTYAHAEELADAFRYLRAHKKKVLCSWEDAGAKALYACASADRIVVNPAGGLRYAGIRTQHMYLGGLLEKIGVHADFVRVGAHKTAPEELTGDHGSDVARDDYKDMLAQYEAVTTKNLSIYRKIPEAEVRASTAKGPFVASEARAAGFVDGYAFDDEIDRAVDDMLGHSTFHEEYAPDVVAPEHFGDRSKIAVLYIDGDMVDGRSQRIPLIDTRLVGSYTIADAVKKIRLSHDYKALVLRIESGGGSSMAADVMWRELDLLAREKTLVISMGSVAASGGYYVAAHEHAKIFAEPLTVTGSIGIFYGKADISGLLKKIGVNIETYRTAPRADVESIYRPFTDDERRELGRKVEQFYDVFLDRVSRGRGMTKDEVDAVGRGRVWSGQEALAHHLVDQLGGLREALDSARASAGLSPDAPVVEIPFAAETLLDRAINLVGAHANASSPLEALPPQFLDIAKALAPMVVFRSDEPLAKIEWIDTP